MNSTVFTGHKNAASMTPQPKHAHKKIKNNIKRIKVDICCASNLLGLLVPMHF